MDKQFCDAFIERKDEVKKKLCGESPGGYRGIFHIVLEAALDEDVDSSDVRELFCDEWEGKLLLVARADGDFYATAVYYGSCTVCDALQRAEGDVEALYSIALHMAQKAVVIKDAA
jgi:hypothetical protein